jgi:thiamine biosynthesis lipoprotein
MMGGEVAIHAIDDSGAPDTAARLEGVLDRLEVWASRLTRYDERSELMRLNAAQDEAVVISPTLTAVLDWARMAESISDGLVDVAMLDARLAAESGASVAPPISASRRWSLRRTARGASVVRQPGLRFDLDGVAKGWLADRALALVPGRSALVDGDGDVAVRVAPGDDWVIGIGDPRETGKLLTSIRLDAVDRPGGPQVTRPLTTGSRTLGIATSGTSVHRWETEGAETHHLIDPRTWRSAATDIVQATVVAGSAREAEVLAKSAVIAGTSGAFGVTDRPGVLGVLVLTTRGELRATPEMLRWLV